jgi:alpha-1,3-glucan synthase
MRARSSLQRFPVAQWLEGLELLQTGAIKTHSHVTKARASRRSGASTPAISSPLPSAPGSTLASPANTRPSSRRPSYAASRVNSRATSPIREELSIELIPYLPPINIAHARRYHPTSSGSDLFTSGTLSENLSANWGNAYTLFPIPSATAAEQEDYFVSGDLRREIGHAAVSRNMSRQNSQNSDTSRSSVEAQNDLQAQDSSIRISTDVGLHVPDSIRSVNSSGQVLSTHTSASVLSLQTVVGEEKTYRMQNVEPSFTDSQGVYAKQFDRLLGGLNGRTSINELCIEEFIIRSEKNWFARFYDAKLGVKRSYNKLAKIEVEERGSSSGSSSGSNTSIQMDTIVEDEFQLGNDHTPTKGMKRMLQYKVRDWPVYSFLLALGQILSANSYQVTLLSGEVGQSAEKLYIVASIYLAGSILWWTLFRTLHSRYVIALPFICYAFAFFILGMAPYGTSIVARGWIQNVATGLYALASGSGSLFFALNFGSEGGTATHTWVFRACVVQGIQQIYVTVLWYWGAHLSALNASGQNPAGFTTSPNITGVTMPVALLLAAIGISLFFGLPDFYCSSPGSLPSFYRALCRRKIILWFFVVVIIQNYFLSAPYGRNWRYLWSSRLVPAWSVAMLVVVFFGFVWIGVFIVFQRLSIEHSWILPIFAIGLGAPRWAQMLWGTSGMGAFIPWAGTPAVGALVGRALWLWLGVLDALQGVGFGMILLQTMTRFHVVFTLTASQVVGSLATIAARATAPDRLGPGTVFPNLALSLDGLGDAVFWVALILQGVVCVGFFLFYRKEQLAKP